MDPQEGNTANPAAPMAEPPVNSQPQPQIQSEQAPIEPSAPAAEPQPAMAPPPPPAPMPPQPQMPTSPDQPPSAPVQPKSPSHVKAIILVFLGFVLLIAIGGVVFALTRQPSVENGAMEATPSITSTAEPVVDLYPGWSTYANTAYKYSFRYPPTLFDFVKTPGSELPAEALAISDDISFVGYQVEDDPYVSMTFGISVNPKDTEGNTISCFSDEACITAFTKAMGREASDVTLVSAKIGGLDVKGTQYVSANDNGNQTKINYLFLKNGTLYNVSVTNNNVEGEDLVDANENLKKMMASLTFTQ